MRRALGVVALLLGGTVTGLGVAEGIARVMWRPPAAAPPQRQPEGLAELHVEEELARPGARGVYNGAYFHANSAGIASIPT